MIPSLEHRHSLGGRACPMLGGSSSSSQATNNTTNNYDKRQVTDNGSVATSGDHNVTMVTQTDQGAVQAGTSVALASISTNSTNTDHLLAAADKLFSQQQSAMQTNVDLTRNLAGTAASAYADAANQASGNKQLILAAMAIVAVVAFTRK